MHELSRDCYQYLMKENPSKQASTYFTGDKFSIMTTNIVESMNSSLKYARSEPTILLLQPYKKFFQKQFLERRNKTRQHTTTLVTKAMDITLTKNIEMQATFLYVMAANLYEFEVHGDNLIGLINLLDKICSSHHFMLYRYPHLCCLQVSQHKYLRFVLSFLLQ